MFSGNYVIKESSPQKITLIRSRQQAAVVMGVCLSAMSWIVFLVAQGKLDMADLDGYATWIAIIAFGGSGVWAMKAWSSIKTRDFLIFDAKAGTLANNREIITPLSKVLETRYLAFDLKTQEQRSTRTYRLLLVIEDERDLLLCRSSKIEVLNEIAEKLDTNIGIPMNLDNLTPQKWY